MSWKLVKLGTLVELLTKGTTPTSIGYKFTEAGINFVKIESIDLNGNFINNKFAKINEACNETLKRSQLKEGDILFSIAGALGRAAIVSKEILPANTNQAIAIIRLKNSNLISREFLLRVLASESILSQVGNMKAGVAQQNLSLSQLKEFLIPVPPLQIQQKIVKKLDKIFAEIDKATAVAETNAKNAEALFQSYLRKVFENDTEVYKNFELGKICKIIGGGTPSKSNPNFYEGSIPWATVRDMNNEVISKTDFKITNEAVSQSSTNIIPKNNVVIATRVGLGKVCIIQNDTAINQDLKGVIPINSKLLEVEYLFYWFKNIAQIIIDTGRGATVHGVKLPFIKSLKIKLPNIETQKKIISRIKEIKSNLNSFKKLTNKKIIELQILKQAILHQAFNGELVKAA